MDMSPLLAQTRVASRIQARLCQLGGQRMADSGSDGDPKNDFLVTAALTMRLLQDRLEKTEDLDDILLPVALRTLLQQAVHTHHENVNLRMHLTSMEQRLAQTEDNLHRVLSPFAVVNDATPKEIFEHETEVEVATDDASAEETAVVNDATPKEIFEHEVEVEKVKALAILATMTMMYQDTACHNTGDVALLTVLEGVTGLLEADDGTTEKLGNACDRVALCVGRFARCITTNSECFIEDSTIEECICEDPLPTVKALVSSFRDLVTLRICALSDYRSRKVFKRELDRAFSRFLTDDQTNDDGEFLTRESQMMHSYEIRVHQRLQMPDNFKSNNKNYKATRRRKKNKERGRVPCSTQSLTDAAFDRNDFDEVELFYP